MNNIETRAHNFALQRAGGIIKKGTKGMIYEGSKKLYIDIANEQDKITKNEVYFIARKCFCDSCPNNKKCNKLNDSIDGGNGDVLTCNHFEKFAKLLRKEIL